jgi:hypothetical protein
LHRASRTRKRTQAAISTSDIDYHVLYINRDGTAQVRLTYGTINVRSTVIVDGKPTPAAQADNAACKPQRQGIEMQFRRPAKFPTCAGLDKIWKASFSGSSTTMTPQQQREMENDEEHVR